MSLTGLSVAVTGTMMLGDRHEVTDYIARHGGRFSASVTRYTDVLVAHPNELNPPTNKVRGAMKYGTPIVGESFLTAAGREAGRPDIGAHLLRVGVMGGGAGGGAMGVVGRAVAWQAAVLRIGRDLVLDLCAIPFLVLLALTWRLPMLVPAVRACDSMRAMRRAVYEQTSLFVGDAILLSLFAAHFAILGLGIQLLRGHPPAFWPPTTSSELNYIIVHFIVFASYRLLRQLLFVWRRYSDSRWPKSWADVRAGRLQVWASHFHADSLGEVLFYPPMWALLLMASPRRAASVAWRYATNQLVAWRYCAGQPTAFPAPQRDDTRYGVPNNLILELLLSWQDWQGPLLSVARLIGQAIEHTSRLIGQAIEHMSRLVARVAQLPLRLLDLVAMRVLRPTGDAAIEFVLRPLGRAAASGLTRLERVAHGLAMAAPRLARRLGLVRLGNALESVLEPVLDAVGRVLSAVLRILCWTPTAVLLPWRALPVLVRERRTDLATAGETWLLGLTDVLCVLVLALIILTVYRLPRLLRALRERPAEKSFQTVVFESVGGMDWLSETRTREEQRRGRWAAVNERRSRQRAGRRAKASDEEDEDEEKENHPGSGPAPLFSDQEDAE